jgi:diguanylate cyclase (GGDEF)-like protein
MRAVLIVQERAGTRISELLGSLFESFLLITANQDVISTIYMDPPDIIFIDRAFLLSGGGSVVREFRSNTVFGHVPIVGLLDGKDLATGTWQEIPIDDYITLDDSEASITRRIRFISTRAGRELDMNPLTRLPGNESIIRSIQGMFDAGEEVAIAWVDIDHFKPFNDRYGFSRGDEVIVATSRIITNALKELKEEKTFVGHIGGDDFVFICPTSHVRPLCEEVISRFDMIIRNFYNDEDLEQGGIVSTGRDGSVKTYRS